MDSLSADWLAWFEAQRIAVDAALSDHLNALKSARPSHSRLLDAVQYSVTLPAKRLRPVLVLESCRACGGSEPAAWPAAIAVELVHTFSLIHDDLPAMDDDELRRGHPTSHKVYGEALAILAGDWLMVHAFELIATRSPADLAPAMIAVLAAAAGDMVAGQAADIEGERRMIDPQLVEYVHRHKTARLIEGCCRLGAIAARAGSEPSEALARYGAHLGLAFQIVDDVLDCTATTGDLGKRSDKDAAAAKQTFPAAFGVEESLRRAREEVASALRALGARGSRGQGVGGGFRGERLAGVARYVLERDR